MKNTIFPTATPADPTDKQPRERPVNCFLHRMPTFRLDARCDLCRIGE